MDAMTPEERARFRAGFRHRCGCDPDDVPLDSPKPGTSTTA
jgi:hypothetical protein